MIRKTILRIVLQPITLSLVIGLVIILLLPPIFNKYNARLISSEKTNLSEVTVYHDLKNSGNSNRIVFFADQEQPHLIIWENDRIVDQWDHQGEYGVGDFYFFADYDHDSLVELYFLTVLNDSVYLNGINPYASGETSFLHTKIDWYKKQNDINDCFVQFIKATDLNGDGYQDLVFSISTGYTAYPRKIYAYDVRTTDLVESNPSCFPILKPMAFDLNKDGVDEFICNTNAYTNCDTLLYPTYSDQKAWLVVFNKNLDYLFDPIPLGEYMSGVKVLPIQTKDSVYLIVYQFYQGTKDMDNRLLLFDINGGLIKERVIPYFEYPDRGMLVMRNGNDKNHLYLIQNDGVIKQIDTALNMSDYVELEREIIGLGHQSDLDDDGSDEFIFSDRAQPDMIITRNDFSHPVRLHNISDLGIASQSIVKSPDGNLIFFRCNGYDLLYSYKQNPLYYLKYGIYLAVFVVLYLLFFTLQKLQHARAQHKFETERKIANLQIKSFKNEIDPHFTLNLINSIGTLFYNQDQKKASYVFDKYSKLLRNTIVSSDNIEISIKDELEFVQNYLELEKFRYTDKFTYKVQIEDIVDHDFLIPKMLIHTFVENSIKHGLRHLDRGGMLEIIITRNEKGIKIRITDNGVGREKAKQFDTDSTTKGLKIIDQILNAYQEIKQVKIDYSIIDLFHESRPAGTKVEINITLVKPRQKFKNMFER